jgi:flagellar biogenesis protein FliO
MGTGTFLQSLDLKRWLAKPRVRRRSRRLRLVETLPLGERRFVAVLSLDGRELLIGATPHSLALLGEIGEEREGGAGARYGGEVQ